MLFILFKNYRMLFINLLFIAAIIIFFIVFLNIEIFFSKMIQRNTKISEFTDPASFFQKTFDVRL